MSVESLIKAVLGEFREIAKTETVVGTPIVAGETVVIPVSKISFGFGAGGGSEDQSGRGSGTGGGGSVEPVGFIVITKGKAQILPMKESEVSIGKLLAMAPDVIKKVKEFRDKREKAREGEAEAEAEEGA